MSTGPTIVREQQKIVASNVSLVNAAEILPVPDDVSAERWSAGFDVVPDGCGGGGLYDVCNNDGPKTYDGSPDIVSYRPYLIYGSDQCGTFGFNKHDFYGRAQRRLAASESYWLERELWTGSMGIDNPALTDATSTEVTTAPVSILEALRLIEDALAECSHGGRYMIHMRPRHAVTLATIGAIRRVGNLWLTPMDNIVVAGRGYVGTGPGSEPDDEITPGSDWIYATSIVQILRGPVQLLPTPDENGKPPASAIERSTNDVFVLAERPAIAAFDPSCCHLAAEVSWTAGDDGGGSDGGEESSGGVTTASTANPVSLDSTIVSDTVLAPNPDRVGLTLTNTDSNAVYVNFGATASSTVFTVLIPAGGYYEMSAPAYTGEISAVWAGDGTGALIGTELEGSGTGSGTAATSNAVSLDSAATAAELLPANPDRIGLTLTNTDANPVYVNFGATASATVFTVTIPASGFYEMPSPVYTGSISAIWTVNGSGALIGSELEA